MVESTAETLYAVCILKEDGGSGVNGMMKFIQEPGKKCRIFGEMTGLSEGQHGFHVH